MSRYARPAASALMRCCSPAAAASGLLGASFGPASVELWARAAAVPAALGVVGLQQLLAGPFSAPCFAAAPLSTSAVMRAEADKSGAAAGPSRRQQRQQAAASEQEMVSAGDGRGDAITDQIPIRPVGVVEGTSYTLAIVAAIAFAAAVLWAAVNELLLEPHEYRCFSLALERLRSDPRVTVRLGTPISGYGSETRNRAARQRVPHRLYSDSEGREHIQIQFYARGPSDVGRVSADLYQQPGSKEWLFAFLLVDIEGRVPQRIMLVEPGGGGGGAMGGLH